MLGRHHTTQMSRAFLVQPNLVCENPDGEDTGNLIKRNQSSVTVKFGGPHWQGRFGVSRKGRAYRVRFPVRFARLQSTAVQGHLQVTKLTHYPPELWG